MENVYVITSNGELYHYGVKGMKWGIRRYQNKDGSLTPAGKKHAERTDDARKKTIAKKVAAAVVMTATVTAAAALYRKNPEAVNEVVSKIGKSTVSGLKRGGAKTIAAGKKYLNEAWTGVKEGFNEGVREAPKKAVKTVITGATLMAAKRMLDSSVGKEESARIFQANNNKKISSFWKVSGEDREGNDDD